MKKLLLSLLIFVPFLTQADFMDDLDQAIRESDISKVKILLQETSLSNTDLLTLIDLSQQMIFYHKGQIECYKATPLAQWRKRYHLLCGGTISLIPIPISICLTQEKTISVNASLGIICASLALSGIFLKSFVQSWNQFENLKNNFDNALTIKQLLLRYKPTHQ